MYKIASYSICKNEINNIDKFLNNLLDADYICILDTGSTDGSWEKLQEYSKQNPRIIVKQKIFEKFRFDVARNESFKLVPSEVDICIVTDFDEYWQRNWYSFIQENWKRSHLIWDIRWVNEKGEGSGGKRNVHKNSSIIKWYYAVHEMLGTIYNEPKQDEALYFDLLLHHKGKRNQTKSYLYKNLLKERLKDDINDGWANILLGLEYLYEERYSLAEKYMTNIFNLEQNQNLLKMKDIYFSAHQNLIIIYEEWNAKEPNDKIKEKINYYKSIEDSNILKQRRLIMKPTLHMVGLFHTICNSDYDHCAFTGKVWRFSKMMQMQGYKVIEYSNGDSLSEAQEKVQIMSEKELMSYTKTSDTVNTVNHSIGTPHWQIFDERIVPELRKRVKDGDIICHPFGPSHTRLLTEFPNAFHVETGIGYPNGDFGAFRIFESNAVMHYHQGMFAHKNSDGTYARNSDDSPIVGRHGRDYEWVVPNYYDLKDWEPNYEPGEYLLFFGRVVGVKGMDIVRAIAEYLDEPIRVVGNGDLDDYKGKNLIIEGPITGAKNKSDLLRNAKAIITPSRFVEPFAGVHAEAMLVGTPVICSDFGVYTETIENGKNGFRCQTLGDYLDAIKNIDKIDRKYVADKARKSWSLEEVGKRYDAVFKQISDLRGKGWYTQYSHKLDLWFPEEERDILDRIVYEE